MARVKTNPILLVSPLDPTCQSGLVRDAIVLNQLGKTSLAVCTAVANQNDVEIDGLTVLSFEEIKRQFDAIGRRYWLDWAVITGIQDLNLAAAIIRYLEQNRPGIKMLWQPVLQHTDRSYQEQLNNQDQALLETLCTKVCTVLMHRRDLLLFQGDIPPADRIAERCAMNSIYLVGDHQHSDMLYSRGTAVELGSNLNPEQQVIFLSTLSSFLYEGIEINEACRQSLLFLSDKPIN